MVAADESSDVFGVIVFAPEQMNAVGPAQGDLVRILASFAGVDLALGGALALRMGAPAGFGGRIAAVGLGQREVSVGGGAARWTRR